MASSSSPARVGNLLLTLPPELRNAIYALVITTDFYELDPTISAKAFPRPRYNIFGIQRGIKAQGGTPAIAQTCRQIRAEALDVHYGRNTIALVGDDSTRRTKFGRSNQIAAFQWMQLIGNDAKYLRKVRFLMTIEPLVLYPVLILVVPDPNKDAPLVSVDTVPKHPSANKYIQWLLEPFERSIQKTLADTGDLGATWRRIAERALYSTKLRVKGQVDLDISDKGITEAKARFPFEMPKLSPRKHTSSNVYQMPDKRPAHTEPRPAKPKQAQVSKRPVELSDDSDRMEIEAPSKKAQTTTTLPAPAKKARRDHVPEEDSDVMEVEAPAKAKSARRARASNHIRNAQGMTARVSEAANNSGLIVTNDQGSNDTVIEAPARKAKTAKKAKAGGAESRPATRASTRKRTPRKL